jgi:hypothetical protein
VLPPPIFESDSCIFQLERGKNAELVAKIDDLSIHATESVEAR